MRWIYDFEQVGDAERAMDGEWEEVRGLLGGKGANLGDMTRLGIPVPPGFTVTTEACGAFIANDERLPDQVWQQVKEALGHLEAVMGRGFGNAQLPLLLACRSGAKFSMPGMMDTVLDLGLNDDVAVAMADLTRDARFAYDSYRRLIQMFATVVVGMKDEVFEETLARYREDRSVDSDAGLPAGDLEAIADDFKRAIARHTGRDFPQDPLEQLRMAIEAVFRSWSSPRAMEYRNASAISHDLGTAVNVQAMVFGNMGDDSATGVVLTRNGTTGEPGLDGDYLVNAQGEDVVAGIRQTRPMSQLAAEMPDLRAELEENARVLEKHYREMQDIEFTIERGKLWILQTRDGKRTARAAVRIAVDQADEGLIDRNEALLRVEPAQVESLLHPRFSAAALAAAEMESRLLGSGLNVSPGAAVGLAVLDPDTAVTWAAEGRPVVLVRPETRPDDVHGMVAAQGIVTTRGGRTSHAALVARQFGLPAVVGADDLEVVLSERVIRVADFVMSEGEWISVDGTSGNVYAGQLATEPPDLDDRWLERHLGWADEARTLGVWANADTAQDAALARTYNAEGIGLCRTEHMFFAVDRLPIVQRMIMAETVAEEKAALAQLLPLQRRDFVDLFRSMAGLPVTIRLIDPPLHEFLPGYDELVAELAELKIKLRSAPDLEEIDYLLDESEQRRALLERVNALRESNPMLGLRGVRLGLIRPAIPLMQVAAIFQAACDVAEEGVPVHPKVMVPLVSDAAELAKLRPLLEAEAISVMSDRDIEVPYSFGTMIEVPRAAVTAGSLAHYAEFFSFGTNDLTQMTYGMSRDDAEAAFLTDYLEAGVMKSDPFESLDPDGVGELMRMAIDGGRGVRADLEIGICGEHGGDADSIRFCHRLGVDYVSASPPRVPVARLAAAHAAILDDVKPRAEAGADSGSGRSNKGLRP